MWLMGLKGLKNFLREFDASLIKHFPFGDHFINSHNLFP